MTESIDWPRIEPGGRRPRRRLLFVVAVLALIFFGGRGALSYYVDVLWFDSLGYGDVFWKTLTVQWGIFAAFGATTFLVLYGSFLALKRAHLPDLPIGHTILIGGRPVKLPVEPVLRLIALGAALVIAAASGAAMMAEWPALALYWFVPRSSGGLADPIFGKPLNFFSVLSTGVAGHRGMAAYAGRDRLRSCRFLRHDHGRGSCALWASQPCGHTTVARALDCLCIFPADPRDADLPGAVRAIAGRSYDLRRRDLHGRARHAHRDADRLRSACSGRGDCRLQRRARTTRAVAGGGDPSGCCLLCGGARDWVVRQQLYRQAE